MKRKLLLGLLICVIASWSFASESDGIFTIKVGQLEISMMVDRENPGNAGILAGADDAILKRYIPAAGFKHSTNTFLIKAPGTNILVDTGFGQVVFQKLDKLGVKPEQIDAVLMTHLHGDHIGGLAKDGKALFPNAKVYVSNKEYDYFTKTQVNNAVVAALAPYGSRVVTFDPSEIGGKLSELLPGFFPIAAYGHTPGHTAYLLDNSGSRFIIWGDLLHVALVQFPAPDISSTYDMDQKAAAAVRRQIMDYAATNKIPIGGMHMVYPAVGTVAAEGTGFKFTPAE